MTDDLLERSARCAFALELLVARKGGLVSEIMDI